MKTKTRSQIKDISLLAISFACMLGFVTLLIRPNHLYKGMLLGAVLGISMGVSIANDD
jgi:hypothetical protein